MSSNWDLFTERLLACGPSAGLVEQGDGSILAACPCPTHGGGTGVDSNPSLRAFLNGEGVVVLKCRAGCETPDVLASLGLTYNDLYEGGREGFTSADDYQVREAVYETLLNHLDLKARHRDKLHQRGFTDEEIERCQYRSIDNDDKQFKRLNAFMCDRFDPEDLARVPGFDEHGLADRAIAGLLIPLRRPPVYPGIFPHAPGPIYLMKSRRSRHEKGVGKYYVWTLPGSTGGEPGFHWAEPPAPKTPMKAPNHCRVAEGEYKADLTAARMGVPSISMPGVTHWQGVVNFMGADKVACFDELRVAWDWAEVASDKNKMRHKLFVFLDSLKASGYPAGVDTWDPTPLPGTSVPVKGIDDAIAAGREVVQLSPDESWAKLADLLGGGGDENFLKCGASSLPGDPGAPKVGDVGAPHPFPSGVLPTQVREWALETAELTGDVAVDYVACPALVVMGRALGTTVKVEAVEGWKVQANLFMVVVAPPGSGKSPPMKAAMQPITRVLQGEESRRFEWEYEAYREKLSVAGPTKKKGVKPPEPAYCYWLDDFTSEAMAGELHANAKSKVRQDAAVLIYNDELSSWVKNMNKYRGGEGDDRETFLTAWAGEDIKVNRKNQDSPPICVEGPFVSVLGATTPDVVNVFETKGGAADGFFPRLLFSMPPVPPPYTFPEKMSVSDPKDKKFSRAKVWELFIRRAFEWKNKCTLIPTTDAYNVLRDYLEEMKAWQLQGLDYDTRAMLSKNRTHVLRLALIVHAMNVVAGASETGKLSAAGGEAGAGLGRRVLDWGRVEKKDAEGAVELIRYFQDHYQMVRRCLVLGPEDRRVIDFVAWVRAKKNRRATPREVYAGTHFGCRGKAEAVKLFKAAVDRGKGVIVPIDGEDVFVPMGST